MTHWKKLVNSPYLGSHDIEDSNPEPILTIRSIDKGTVIGENGKKDERIVAEFAEQGIKPMILNNTNCKTITRIYGTPQIEDWIGKKIQLFVAQVKVAGEVVDALRIRPRMPEQARLDPSEAISRINGCKTIEELQSAFKSLPKALASDVKVIAEKDKKKAELSAG